MIKRGIKLAALRFRSTFDEDGVEVRAPNRFRTGAHVIKAEVCRIFQMTSCEVNTGVGKANSQTNRCPRRKLGIQPGDVLGGSRNVHYAGKCLFIQPSAASKGQLVKLGDKVNGVSEVGITRDDADLPLHITLRSETGTGTDATSSRTLGAKVVDQGGNIHQDTRGRVNGIRVAVKARPRGCREFRMYPILGEVNQVIARRRALADPCRGSGRNIKRATLRTNTELTTERLSAAAGNVVVTETNQGLVRIVTGCRWFRRVRAEFNHAKRQSGPGVGRAMVRCITDKRVNQSDRILYPLSDMRSDADQTHDIPAKEVKLVHYTRLVNQKSNPTVRKNQPLQL
jgi:hypothetical protein